MVKIGGWIFTTPQRHLFLSRRSQQRTIAVSNQSKSDFDEADDPVSRFMRSPFPARNALARQNYFGNLAIGCAVSPCI